LRRTYPKIRTIPSILEASFSDVASFNSLTSSSFTATPFAFEEDLLSSPAYQRARRTLATSKGSATTGDRSDRETLMPERPSVMQQRSQDHEQLMKEKLDIAYKEIMMAAEREKLYYEELKKSLEEIEETSMLIALVAVPNTNSPQEKSLEAREEALKKFAQRDEELVLDLMHMNKELENSKATIKTLEADLARLDKIRSKELEEARSEYIMKIRKMETCISDISKGPTKVEVESPNPSDLIKALEAHLKHRQDLHSHALEAASSEYRKNIRKLETCIADISEDATRLQSDSPIFYTITRPGTGNKNGNRIKDKRWRIKKGPYSEMSSLVSPKETGKDQSENTEPVLTYRHRFVWSVSTLEYYHS
jgi:hypothetical protein